jgi:hypothetical protein
LAFLSILRKSFQQPVRRERGGTPRTDCSGYEQQAPPQQRLSHDGSYQQQSYVPAIAGLDFFVFDFLTVLGIMTPPP